MGKDPGDATEEEMLGLKLAASMAAAIGLFVFNSTAAAATYYWTVSSGTTIQGGSSTWSTGASNNDWCTSRPGTARTYWTNGNNNADFYTGAGTVTVSGSITVGNIIL